VKHTEQGDEGDKQKKIVDRYLFSDPGLLHPKFYKNWILSCAAWVLCTNQVEKPLTLISLVLWSECLFYGLATGQSTLQSANTNQFEKVKSMAVAFNLNLDAEGNLVIPGAKKFPLAGTGRRLMWRGKGGGEEREWEFG